MNHSIYEVSLPSASQVNSAISEIMLPSASRADRNIAGASKGHCVVHTVLGRGAGIKFQAESYLEFANLLMLNANPDVTYLREQARFDWEDIDGKPHRHFFDAYAIFNETKRIAFTVKPQVRLASGRFLEEIQEVTRQAIDADFCDAVRLITEQNIGPIQLQNAAVYQAVREKDAEADQKALAVVHNLKGAVNLRDLTILIDLEARGYRALIRLCRDGILASESLSIIVPDTKLVLKAY